MIIGVIFLMVIIFRATRRDSLKKMFKMCFPARQQRVQERRRQEEAVEMARLGSNKNLPDVIRSCAPETLEDRIQKTAFTLNMLTMQRAGQREDTGTVPQGW